MQKYRIELICIGFSKKLFEELEFLDRIYIHYKCSLLFVKQSTYESHRLSHKTAETDTFY